MSDFAYDWQPNWWVQPETGVMIADEDMPEELAPVSLGMSLPSTVQRDGTLGPATTTPAGVPDA